MSEVANIPGGAVHDLPDDIAAALITRSAARETWQHISPLAGNEWICCDMFPKQPPPEQSGSLGEYNF